MKEVNRLPDDISMRILTKECENIDDVTNELEVTKCGVYLQPSHHDKGFLNVVKKKLVIGLTRDLIILDKV
tara:strand:- start:11 stop:223 length:213 start_codon:yes stop_codon:yes gene_type:complete